MLRRTLAVGVLGTLVGATRVTGDTLPVVADSQVSLTAVAAKGGGLTTTTVKSTLPGPAYRAFAKFDLSALQPGLPVSKATLRLWVNTVTTEGDVEIAAALGAWDEATLAAITAPQLSEAVGGFEVTKARQKTYVNADVTQLVQDWVSGTLPNHGLALLGGTRPVNARFDTKENPQTSRPMELEVVLGLPPGSGDITGISPGTGLVGGGNLGQVTLAADFAVVQRRRPSGDLNGTCPQGSSIRALDSLGYATCQPDLGLSSYRDTDGTFSGNLPLAITVHGCKTSTYTPAQSGERAFVWVHASCSGAPAGSGIGVRVGLDTGSGDSTTGGLHRQTNTGTLAGYISSGQFAAISLNSGTAYRFTTAVTRVQGTSAWAPTCDCHTMVQIER